ncbi:stage V sporulation protein B [Polycladospora coralii]|uniref:stage V sporulation protein B n=1 Tax=Polycladospora coralii TaxID=2771432 RepID=UPI001CD11753|nr:stage V sporulation protein B [Polycladospora coralii]
MNKQSFLHGTLILVGAGFLTKILGFIYRIALSRIIGDEGMGLFQMAFPILIFTIVVTTAGLPVAISKLVSEAEAKGESHRIRSILIVSIVIVFITSITVTALVLITAPLIASTLLTDARAIYSLLGIAPIIPIIAISSIFRGYFQGRQNMSPYAISTIIEQMVRIFTVLLLAHYLLPFGIEYAAAGAMIGMVIGEFTGMFYLLYSFKKDPTRPVLNLGKRNARSRLSAMAHIKTLKKTLSDLLRLALPVTASRLVGSFAYAIEPIVVAQSLALAGITASATTALYGQLEGMAVPIVFFPAFITYALSVSLVPAVSEAAAQNQHHLVEYRLQQALRLSLVVGAPCSLLIYFLAEPLSILLFKQSEVAHLMQIMAPFAILYYLQGPLSSVLQGLDRAPAAMKNTIIGALIKTALIFVLASRPELGIDGVALAVNAGIIIVTILHFISILKSIPFSLHINELARLFLSIMISGIVTYFCVNTHHDSLMIKVLITTFFSLFVYLLCIMLFAVIKQDDVKRIPYIGKPLCYFLPR